MKQFDNTIDEIIYANTMLQKQWGNLHGWAPETVVYLISGSQLDRQFSFSKTFKIWIENSCLLKGIDFSLGKLRRIC